MFAHTIADCIGMGYFCRSTVVHIPSSGRDWVGDLSVSGSMQGSGFPAAEQLSQGLGLVKDDLRGPTLANYFYSNL